MAEKPDPNKDLHGRERVFYGRRRGRPLRAGMQGLLDDVLPDLRISTETLNPDSLDARSVFDAERIESGRERVWLEIGFGGGEHLAAQMAANLDVGFIGCEPFINGVASLLRHVEEQVGDDEAGAMGRLRLVPDDARPLLDALKPGTLDRIFVLHPDPWPKKRHHFRRIIQFESIARFHALLRPGGELRIATDDIGYLRWILARVTAHPGFRWTARRPSDWRDRPEDWPETRYEAKGREQGRPPTYLRFERV